MKLFSIFRRLLEAVTNARRFWIKDDGHIADVTGKMLHSEYAEQFFGCEEDPMKLAERAGWIRVSFENGMCYAECIRNKVSHKTFVSLKDELRSTDDIFIIVITDDHYYKEYEFDVFMKRSTV